MHSRRPAARWIASIVAGMIMAAATASGQSLEPYSPDRFTRYEERFAPETGDPVVVRVLIARERDVLAPRVIRATHAALATLTAWLGHPGLGELTVAAVPWTAEGQRVSRRGFVAVPIRWIELELDRSLERALIAAIASQYWMPQGSLSSHTFAEAVAMYSGLRAMHDILEGSNFAVVRFFGGFVPYPLRTVSLSPRVADPRPRMWRFNEWSHPAPVVRVMRALQTIERFVGWPAMAQALAAMRHTPDVPYDAASFASALFRATGVDIAHLFGEFDRKFDYAVDNLAVTRSGERFETTVRIGRHADGRFTLADPRTGDGETSIPVLIRFADGSEVRDWIDGAAESTDLVFTAASPAVVAAVDPDVLLLLDSNRGNNTRSVDSRANRVGIRLALHWMAWLQNAVLSYASLV